MSGSADPPDQPDPGAVQGSVEGTWESDTPGSYELRVKITPESPPAPADKPPAGKKTDKNLILLCHAVVLATILWMAACVFAPPAFFPFTVQAQYLWIVTLAFFIADGVAIGYTMTGNAGGIFINERKLMSISRAQVALWSLLILSAFFTIFVIRLRAGVADPVNIGIDTQLWAVMGISLGSLAGRTYIMGKKGNAQPKPEKFDRAVVQAGKALKESSSEIKDNAIGVLYANKDTKNASLMDMFQGDEVGNTWLIDIGKIQMFFFTIITIITYGAAIWALLLHTAIGSITALPPLNDGFVALLGISHAGLLANSGTTVTPTET
ncbi:MAG: hypothetical protein A4E35_01958 [Methanoregula sp. PtaU1.Bin051]|nr:MAG: hypothetical protein A4E35_01958 [Methanoregula sp. PtaU1.Bin051]